VQKSEICAAVPTAKAMYILANQYKVEEPLVAATADDAAIGRDAAGLALFSSDLSAGSRSQTSGRAHDPT
jgi:hypothetical protein